MELSVHYYCKNQRMMEEEYYVMNLIFVAALSWTSLFLALRKALPHRSLNFCNRIVSILHASLAVSLASFSVHDWTCPFCPLSSSSSPIQINTLAVSVGYLLYDLFCCLFDNTLMKMDNTLHHLVSIVGLASGLAYKRCGSELVGALWMTEMSSPLLHFRELLKELGYRDTHLNLAADMGFAVIFTFARMVGGPYLTYVTMSAPNNPFLIKVMALGLQVMSGFWFYKIVKMVIYKLGKKMTQPPYGKTHVS